MTTASAASMADRFRELHERDDVLVLANPWDEGSAKLLASCGFEALATTSGGFAASRGRADGSVTRDEALAQARAVVSAVDVPVSADLENGFADEPSAVAETVRLAVEAGLAGCSVEDFAGRADESIYPLDVAVERVRAAVDVAHSGPVGLVLTARSENYLHGRPDLSDTIARLQAFQDAGADVLYAPGLSDLAEIRQVVAEVDRPLNVLALPGGPTVGELHMAGVRRVSVGGAFAMVALGALADAARELLHDGTFGFWDQALRGRQAFGTALKG